MQGILDIKLKMETQARQEFAQAKIALDKELEMLEVFHVRKRMYEEQASQLLKGRLDVLEIVANKEAIIHAEDAITEQNVRVEMARLKLDEVREKLKNIMQERKVHETLKDKAFEEFLMEEKQQESKEIDELTSYIYGQKLLVTEETDAEDIGDGSQTRS
jgi:flagellar FliJ protein